MRRLKRRPFQAAETTATDEHTAEASAIHQASGSAKQVELYESTAKTDGFVGGRGAGKTWAGAHQFLRRLTPGAFHTVYAPEYATLRDATIRTLESHLRNELHWPYRKIESKSYLIVDPGGFDATIAWRSTENPERLRGPNNAAVWCDEAGRMSLATMEIIAGTLRHGGERGYWLNTFTPTGKAHWTYDTLVRRPQGTTKLVHAKTSDNAHASEEYHALLARLLGTRAYRQDFEGEFMDEGTLLPFDILATVAQDGLLWTFPWKRRTGPLYIGFDVARSHNLSVLWTWERLGDVAWTREVLVMRDTAYPTQKHELERRLRHPQVVKCCVDTGGAGRAIVEHILNPKLQKKIELVAMGEFAQGAMAETMRVAAEIRAIRIPNEPEIFEDFGLVGEPEYRRSRLSLRREDVGENDEGSHADRFWAAALGLYGFSNFLPKTYANWKPGQGIGGTIARR